MKAANDKSAAMKARVLFLLLAAFAALLPSPALAQRDAAFVQPSMASGGHKEGDEVIEPSPKLLDVGETSIGVTKRVTLFFTNYSGRDAVISSLSINADSNVRTEAVQNDCAAIKSLKPNDKCTVIIEITPNSPGKWTAEVVAVHDGIGRISRATLSGATSGDASNNGQLPGLSLVGPAKDQQIDFGDVPGDSHAVRTVLLANDSPSPLKIERIMLMSADKGLTLLDKDGCVEGMEVQAGSSCPVTVEWQPQTGNSGGGEVSTDLIIRHTGPIGFAVIPVRGKSGGGTAAAGNGAGRSASAQTAMAIPPLGADDLFAKAANEAPETGAARRLARKAGAAPAGPTRLSLRGTTGDQALIGTEDGTVVLVGVGQAFQNGDATYRILFVDPTSVTLETAGRKVTLALQKPTMTITGERSKDGKNGSSQGGQAGQAAQIGQVASQGPQQGASQGSRR